MIVAIFIVALIGLAISLYAAFVEYKIKEDPNYHPICNLSDRISCSKPLASKYSKLFFISNSFAGITFYSAMAVLAFYDASGLLFFAALGACLASVVLGYILYFKVKSLCLICTSLYVTNITLLLISWRGM